MSKKYYCDVCNTSFVSWPEMKEHFRTREHKNRSRSGRLGPLLDKFAKHFKELDNEPDKV